MKIYRILKTGILAIIFSLLFISSANAQNLKTILAKVEKNEKLLSSKSKASQIITTSKGKIRTLKMTAWSKDNSEKQLNVYTSPSRVKGDKILQLNDGDDIWFYTPKTDRVRHLAKHAKKRKVQGSDFSYEDMQNWEYDIDFESTLLGEETVEDIPCHKIELIPTETGPQYSKMIVWIDKTKFVARRTDYYEDGDLLKRLTVSNIVKIKSYWIPKKLLMQNLQDGGKTIYETHEIEVNIEVSDKLFSTNSLKKR